MDKEKQIDDLVNMIDSFMANNGGHMNVTVDKNGKINTDTEEVDDVTVKTMNSLDCAMGDLACNVPTLFEGLDEEE
ncbi:MAG: hypothetical protein ACI4VF_08305 [Lachnospirales bacterium]